MSQDNTTIVFLSVRDYRRENILSSLLWIFECRVLLA